MRKIPTTVPAACRAHRIRRDHEQTTAPEHAPAFKSKVALAAIKGDRTLAELAEPSNLEKLGEFKTTGAIVVLLHASNDLISVGGAR
jgi:hypothetical protein